MRTRLFSLIKIYLFWLLIFVLEKPVFLAVNLNMSSESLVFLDWFRVIRHGLTIDSALAACIAIIPGVLLAASFWFNSRILNAIWRICLAPIAIYVSASFLVNLILYGYWGFPLDTTPIFLLFSAPEEGLECAPIWQLIVGFSALFLASLLLYSLQKNALVKAMDTNPGQIVTRPFKSLLFVCLSGLLIIPARAGVIQSESSIRKAYFSNNVLLDHAAVNPAFSFLESLTEPDDFGKRGRFMETAAAEAISNSLTNTTSEGTEKILSHSRPDIYIVLLESFSTNLFDTDAVPNLKEIADNGLLFTNFYANSFRTDRGMLSTLCGFPAPSMGSLMQHQNKVEKIPSIGSHLSEEGYDLKYFYGGDVDFASMRHSLSCQNFVSIIGNSDFSISERSSTWGAPDEFLFQKALDELPLMTDTSMAYYRVIQTSSSHEPFDVPYHKFQNEKLNAFAYTDSCLGHFIDNFSKSERWNRALIILIPDHYGCYPENIPQNDLRKYHVPCIWIGGALDTAALSKYKDGMPAFGSQHDLAATVLGQLGISHDDIIFSKDLFNPTISHFAFFAVPDIFGMVTDSAAVVFDNKALKPLMMEGEAADSLLTAGKAYLQKIYDTAAQL